MGNADLEIRLYSGEAALLADIRFASDDTTVESVRVQGAPILLNHDQLRAAELDRERYGRLLTSMLFADSRMGAALNEAVQMARSRQQSLRFRLRIDLEDDLLHAVSWERLTYPERDTSFALSRQILFTRYLEPHFPEPMPAPLRGDLRALIVIASPTYTRGSTLDPINVADLERRALAALGDFTPRVLARPNAMPTIDNLEATLAEHQPDLVYIACHGVEEEGETFLLLEQPSGEHFPLRGRRLAEIMGDLSYRPRLVVLAVCHSSGSGAADRELMKLGPRLVRAGVPAVIAMRGAVSFQAAEIFVDSLLKELSRHGQIDLAMATARNSLDNASQHRWMPVLTMRLRDGALWVPRIAASIPPTRQEPGYMMRGRLYNDGPTSRGSIFPEQPRNGEHGREGGMMQPRDLDIHRRGEVARRAQPSGQALESGEQILDYVRSVLDEALFQSEGPSRETIDRIVQMLGVAAEQAERAEDPSRQQHTVAFEHARLCYLCGQHEEAEKLLLQVELFAIKAGAMALINDLREYRRCIEVRRALDGLRKQGEPREQQAKEAVRRLQRVLEQHRSPAASLLMEIISELAITTEEQVNAAALSLRLGVDSPPE